MLLLTHGNIEVPLQKYFSHLYHRVLVYSAFRTDNVSWGRDDIIAIFEPRTSRVSMRYFVKHVDLVRKNGAPHSTDLIFIKRTNRLFHFSHKIPSPLYDRSIILKRMYAKIGSRRVNYRGTINTDEDTIYFD